MKSSLLWPASARARGFRPKKLLASFCKYLITVSPGVRASTLLFEFYQRSGATKFLSILSTSYRDNLSTLQPQWYMILPSEDGIGISLCHLRALGQVPRVSFCRTNTIFLPTHVQMFVMRLPCRTSHSTGERAR